MSRAPVITEIGHIAIQVRDLEAAERFSVDEVGLHVTKRTADQLWLTHGTEHHTVHYIRGDEDAVDHVGLVAADADAVAEIRSRVDAAGLDPVADFDHGDEVEDGFAFRTPEGFVFEIYGRMSRVDAPPATSVLRPRRLGHVNFFPRDTRGLERTLTEVLDFRVSDRAGEGADEGVFLRCNVDHHGIGIFPGAGLVHHYAWEYASMLEIAAIADAVDARGGSTLWGPMRHGMGRNIATYVQEPSGLIVEFYSDMERIYDDENHVPGQWRFEGHKWMSLWAVHEPAPGFSELGLPPVRVPG
jgi:catechol 2,3-dioxygenase-like lactoylglutathione lyase family enzyme